MTVSPVLDAPYLTMLDQIDHLPQLAPRLARIRRLRRWIDALWPNGHPTRFVHVSGTSGKGSVCRFLEAGFALSGPAGSYTGPHLFDYRERFSVNGVALPAKAVLAAWEEVVLPFCVELADRTPADLPKYGEVGLLLALVLFDRHKVAWAAMETGYGGKYDPRMALDVAATVVTNVGRDHEELLGGEGWQRALEKSGSARAGVPMFTMMETGDELEVLKQICAHIGAPLTVVGDGKLKNFDAELKAALPNGLPPDSLLGARHQRHNAALAMSIVNRLHPQVDRTAMLERLARLPFLGRFHKVDDNLYADLAHNPDKIDALMAELRERFGPRRYGFVVGLSGDRAAEDVFVPLMASAAHVIVTRGRYKGADLDTVAASLKAMNSLGVPLDIEPDPRKAVKRLKVLLANSSLDVGLITGSTYLIDDALNPNPYLRHLNAVYGWRKRTPA